MDSRDPIFKNKFALINCERGGGGARRGPKQLGSRAQDRHVPEVKRNHLCAVEHPRFPLSHERAAGPGVSNPLSHANTRTGVSPLKSPHFTNTPPLKNFFFSFSPPPPPHEPLAQHICLSIWGWSPFLWRYRNTPRRSVSVTTKLSATNRAALTPGGPCSSSVGRTNAPSQRPWSPPWK